MENQIDQELLRKVQLIQLDMLIEFDRICKANNLKYQLFAGSLLGAIRHNGFIPWDDDVDVAMLRSDYEKFLDICNDYLSPDYFLQTYETDPNYHRQFARLRKNNTKYLQQGYKDLDIHHGIFIDIFPMDNVKPFSFVGRIHLWLCHFLVYGVTYSMNKSRCYSAKNPLIKYIRLLLHYFTKLFPKRFLFKLADSILCMFNNQETGYVGCLTDSDSIEKYYNFIVKKDTFYDLIEWEFEGHKFPIPREYDYVLTNNYGDYMTPPPPEKQKPHHGIIEIILDTTSKNMS